MMKRVPDMTQLSGASLLPPGEGQDEGIKEIGKLHRFDPLTQPSPGGRGSLWDSSEAEWILVKEGLNNSSFRRKPESSSLNFWIPAFAGMTKLELIRVSLNRKGAKKAFLNRQSAKKPVMRM
jgi:hypothetical protein